MKPPPNYPIIQVRYPRNLGTTFFSPPFLLRFADIRVEAQPGRLHLDGRVGGRGRRRQPQGVRPDVPPQDSELREVA